MSQKIRERGRFGFLRGVALIMAPVGAAGSVGLMLRAGHRNNSIILLALFTAWVISPFVALILADAISNSKPWPVRTRVILHSVTLVLTLGSLAIYGYVTLAPPRAKIASVFVLVPPASWLLLTIAALISRIWRPSKSNSQTG